MNDEHILGLVKKRSHEIPNHIAFTFLKYENNERNEINITFKELYDNSLTIANQLKANGLDRGDHVIIFSSQTYDNIYAIYGTLFAGGIFTVIPPPIDENKQQRFRFVYESIQPKFILGNTFICTKIKGLFFTEDLQKTNSESISTFFKQSTIIDIEKCVHKRLPFNEHHIPLDHLAYIQYSSGSTNTPKGVMINHQNIMQQLEALNNLFKQRPSKNIIGWVPLFHNLGLIGLAFFNIYTGIKSVIMSPLDFVEEPVRWFQSISDYSGEITLAPDSTYGFCGKMIPDSQLEGIDLSNLKWAVNGAEPIDFDNYKAFVSKFEKFGFNKLAYCPGYGLAESVCVVSASTTGIAYENVCLEKLKHNQFIINRKTTTSKKIVGTGKLLKGLKGLIVNPETLKVCNENEIGEIWLQGDIISEGYWNSKETTEKTFRATLKNHDGYFMRTGDLGIICHEQLYITGRIKDLIIINGHNIYSHDIQLNIRNRVHSLNTATIVSFSVTTDKKEHVITCIDIISRNPLDYSALSKAITNCISKTFEFLPYEILFVEEGTLPKTDTGKVQISKTKQLYESKNLSIIFSSREQNDEHAVHLQIKPGNKYEKTVTKIFSEVFNTEKLNVTDNFFALGGNSLSIPHMVHQIEKTFNISFPIKYFLENPTIDNIAKTVSSICNNEKIISAQKNKAFFYSECVLDPDIQPGKYTKKTTSNQNVFLTGSTGFVGAQLIKDLIEIADFNVYCHVRAKDKSAGMTRIIENMKFYKCWKDVYKSRIFPIIGDLAKPLMGINKDTYHQLSKKIDAVYHNGALLNFVYPYSYLKKINVYGTQECIRFACENKAKYFYYVSTFSVFDNPSYFKKTAFEDHSLDSPEGYFLGYSETKWVAEKIIQIAIHRGLRASIFRPGEITGSYKDGIWKMTDLVSRFIVSTIQLKVMPKIPLKVHMTPVDYVSQSIVSLSLKENSVNKAFNLVNKNVKNLIALCDYINAYGYNVKLIDYNKWREYLENADDRNALKLLKPLFFEEKKESESITRRYTDLEAKFDISNTLKGLKDTNITCPKVDKDLIFKYLDNFVNLDYLEKPIQSKIAT